jgi:hypothetical protein
MDGPRVETPDELLWVCLDRLFNNTLLIRSRFGAVMETFELSDVLDKVFSSKDKHNLRQESEIMDWEENPVSQ